MSDKTAIPTAGTPERVALRNLLAAMEAPRSRKASDAWDAAHQVMNATPSPARVWMVEGGSNQTPGRPVSIHGTEAGAATRAAELCNALLEELEEPQTATPDNWRETATRINELSGGDSWVEATAMDVRT